MRRALLLVVCGCNQIYGLQQPQLDPVIDAQFFDAPLDAAFTCPAIGTAPTFVNMVHQVPLQSCDSYVPSEVGTAMALCSGVVEFGVGNALAPVVLSPVPVPTIDQTRLSPEGNLAFVRQSGNLGYIQLIFQPDATNTWNMIGTLPIPPSAPEQASTPSLGPNRHVLVWTFDYGTNTNILTELVGDANAWQPYDTYTSSDFGLASVFTDLSLTSDGLRLIFKALPPTASTEVTYYADRPDLMHRFGAAQVLSTVPPGVSYPFLTDGCARVYFSALNTTLYLEQ